MENKINIAEILKDCPKGMKLYSPLFGELKFGRLDSSEHYPILIDADNSRAFTFDSNGRFYSTYPTAECLLFPSSEMRDWTKFFKRGDVVIKNGDGMAAVFDGWANDIYTEFNTTINLYCDGNTGEEEVCDTHLFRKATGEERNLFIKEAERILKGKYNLDTLQVEPIKPKCPFKPFDKVLVRDNNEQKWIINLFSHYDKDDSYKYFCLKACYKQCIFYKGNEYLLGTTDPYTEGGDK